MATPDGNNRVGSLLPDEKLSSAIAGLAILGVTINGIIEKECPQSPPH